MFWICLLCNILWWSTHYHWFLILMNTLWPVKKNNTKQQTTTIQQFCCVKLNGVWLFQLICYGEIDHKSKYIFEDMSNSFSHFVFCTVGWYVKLNLLILYFIRLDGMSNAFGQFVFCMVGWYVKCFWMDAMYCCWIQYYCSWIR